MEGEGRIERGLLITITQATTQSSEERFNFRKMREITHSVTERLTQRGSYKHSGVEGDEVKEGTEGRILVRLVIQGSLKR